MKNFNKQRLAALLSAGIVLISAGCGTKTNTEDKGLTEESSIEITVDNTRKGINTMMPEVNNDIVDNTSIMLLLDLFAKQDENGKINATDISKFKSKINVEQMLKDFDSFLDILEQYTTENNKVYKVSELLPEEFSSDKEILSNLELILENIIKLEKEDNKEELLKEFNKLYTIFAEGKELEDTSLLSLNYIDRAVANRYAQIGTYYCRNYITEEQYKKMDRKLDNQNNRAQIIILLSVLSNEQSSVDSKIDVINVFNERYELATNLLSNKVNLNDSTIKNLVNRLNLKYLLSDAVSYKDQMEILGEYDEAIENELFDAVSSIFEYNINNPKNIIVLSDLLINEYKEMDSGKIDRLSLNFTQNNTIRLLVEGNNDVDKISNNPYFKNIINYVARSDFHHAELNEEGIREDYNIKWQEISDGVTFVNDSTILYLLSKLPSTDLTNNIKDIEQFNFDSVVYELQELLLGKCKTDNYQYVLNNN